MSKRRTIGIDARFLLRPMRGMPAYVNRLCEGLPRLRPNYDFVLFINRGFERNDTEASYRARLDRVSMPPNVRLVNADSEAEVYWEQVLLPRLARKHSTDLLHMPGNRVVFGTRVPQIVTFHDVMELIFLRQLVPIPPGTGAKLAAYLWRQRLYLWATYRRGVHRARHVITDSHHSAADIAKHLGYPSDRVSVIHLGVEDSFSLGGLPPMPFGHRRHCLMLGGDSFQKNPSCALAAWAALPEPLRLQYPLRIAGFAGGPDSDLLRAVHRLGLQESVIIDGWLPQQQLVDLFRQAALFLFMSRYEGFGLPIVQAMASGTPVVHSTAASLAEVAGTAGCGVAPDDVQGVTRAMIGLLQDEAQWADRQAAGLERARAFSWEEAVKAHAEVYDRVLGPV